MRIVNFVVGIVHTHIRSEGGEGRDMVRGCVQ